MANIVSKIKQKQWSLTECRWIAYTLIMFAIIFYGWVSDDSHQGLVQVVNLFDGGVFGYNMIERVNASTCILFDFLAMIPYSITRSVFWSALIVNILSSGVAIYVVLFKLCDDKFKVIATSTVMLSSYYFLCFCTSGLENSLIFMFGSLFVYMYTKTEKWTFGKLLLLALIDSGLLLSRLDMAIIFLAPTAYVYLFKRENKSVVKMVLAGITGLIPLIVWLVFSVWYYGVPFPTTYYAKLNAGIPELAMLESGLFYVAATLVVDIIFSFTMIFCICYMFAKGNCRYKIFGVSLILRFIYVIWIGGDFMYIRMFTDIFFISLCLFNSMNIDEDVIKSTNLYKQRYAAIILVTFLSFVSEFAIQEFTTRELTAEDIMRQSFMLQECATVEDINQIIETQGPFMGFGKFAITDERFYYASHFSVQSKIGLPPTSDIRYPFAKSTMSDRNYSANMSYVDRHNMQNHEGFVFDGVFFGYAKCVYNDIYIVDTTALGNLFLAQLNMDFNPDTWRVGHNYRVIPDGYKESLYYNANLIEDPSLHEYYDVILELTRGDLFDKNRWKLIWDFNTGKYDYLLDEYYANLVDAEIDVAETVEAESF